MNAAAEIIIASIPLVAIIMLGIVGIFFLTWDYRKYRLLIEKNISPPRRNFDEKLLLLGIVSTFVGVGLLVFFAISRGVDNALLGGIIPTMTGMGIILHYILMHSKK